MRDYVYKAAYFVLCLIVTLTFAIPAYAEVVLDGTLGVKGSITGPNFNITSTMGQTYGGNLFHSFSSFNLNNTESAIFSGPSTVINIISRVTGGQASSIDGTIKSTIVGADFWFINPSGIVFGQNAKLDVSGSFHASTADYIKLSDNSSFDALNPAAPILTSAPPSAFGFLSSNPTAITLKDGAFLKVSEGMTLSLVGGNLDIQNSNLYASAGTINLISVASAGEAVVDRQNFKVDTFNKLGEINIKETRPYEERPVYDFDPDNKMGNIDTSGTGGGMIFLRGGKFFVDGGHIKANTYGDINGKGIDIFATNSVKISGANSDIESLTWGEGKAGSINIETGKLDISEGAYIAASTATGSKGDAGSITIKATDSVDITGHYAIGSSTYASSIRSETFGKGKAGNISIDTAKLKISDGADISTSARQGSEGDGGSITIKATDSVDISGGRGIQSGTWGEGKGGSINIETGKLNISEGAYIAASAENGSKGDAGNVTIKATDSVDISGGWGILSLTWGEGKGGSINIETGKLNISDSAYIAATAEPGSKGDAGNITIKATDSVVISGNGSVILLWTWGEGKGGSINIDTAILNISDYAYIAASAEKGSKGDAGNITIKAIDSVVISGEGSSIRGATFGEGKGGSINIETAKLDISAGSYISVSAYKGSKGDAGDITIKATDSIDVSGNFSNESDISAITSATFGEGKGGSINIDTAILNISDYAYIEASAKKGSKGDAGNITIKAIDSVVISGEGSSIRGATFGKGKAGNISVDTAKLDISDGGEISVKSSGTGNAGEIHINSSDTIQLVDSSVTTAADSSGGGQIYITAGRIINLINSEITATVAGGTSSGGNITATAPFLILNQSNIIAKADEGKGGNINLKTDTYIRTLDSEVSASSRLGIDGTVYESTPAIDLSGKVALLQVAYTDTAVLAPKQCVEREEELSSFIVKGRDGLPPFPDSLLAIP